MSNEADPGKKIILDDVYGHETTLQKYRRLAVGLDASILDWVGYELCTTFLSGVKGALGLALRKLFFPLVYSGFSRSSIVGSGVTLRCPMQIHLGDRVVIDEYVQLIGNSAVTPSVVLADGCFVRSFAMINAGPPNGYVRIGQNSGIGQSTIIYGNGGVTIGRNVMIAGQCFIVASSHLYTEVNTPIKDQGFSAKGIVIEDNVWVGAGSKILDGVRVGRGAIVAAGSVVHRAVEPATIVGGIPAKLIRRI